MAEVGELLRAALAAMRAGRAAEAEAKLRQALAISPAEPRARELLGVVLLELERPSEALVELDAAAAALPPSPLLQYNRGNALSALASVDQALRAYAQACALRPGFAEAHFNAGNLLRAQGRTAEALAQYQAAAAASPGLARAHWRVGHCLLALGREQEALAPLDRALALEAGLVAAHIDRGVALHQLGQVEAALAASDAALALAPEDADAWNNRGNAMHDLQRMPEALACYERALALRPDWPEALCNRGMALQDLRRFDEAQAAYDAALARRPGYHEALKRRAGLHLLLGDHDRGWSGFEDGRAAKLGDEPGAPRWWRGEDLAGRSILLSEPNGIGDLLQFLRFVPKLFEHGARRVAFAAPARFHRLLRDFDARVEWLEDEAAPGFDFRCWGWSLPHWLRVGDAVAAPAAPLLRPEPALVARWRAKLDPDFINVGIAWQGNPTRKIDRGRSLPLAEFAPLARVPGVRLFSLQKQFGTEQLQSLPPGMQVQVPEGGFDEGADAFVDTAAMLASLDLVVCSDSSLAHLAGALDRPAWVLLKPVPDWRWQLDREDSPWYPRARLFRQRAGDGWQPVLERAASALESALPALRAARSR